VRPVLDDKDSSFSGASLFMIQEEDSFSMCVRRAPQQHYDLVGASFLLGLLCSYILMSSLP
jgi:hypothetical protein